MDAFATVEDYEARWGALDEDEAERVEYLLRDASAYIAAELVACGIDYSDPDELLKANLIAVTCAVAHRVYQVSDDRAGITQWAQSGIGLSESYSFANPSGDMYLTAAERRRLGITGAHICVKEVVACEGRG